VTGEPLRIGQAVYWNDPDNGLCSGYGTIADIQGDIIVLAMDDGGEVEAYVTELEEV
jgi:hypothetical protein